MEFLPFPVQLMEQAQAFQGQEFVHFLDGLGFGGDEGSHPRWQSLGMGSHFFLHAEHDFIGESHVAENDARLHGLDGILSHHPLGSF